jgi:hypothetical protein
MIKLKRKRDEYEERKEEMKMETKMKIKEHRLIYLISIAFYDS